MDEPAVTAISTIGIPSDMFTNKGTEESPIWFYIGPLPDVVTEPRIDTNLT